MEILKTVLYIIVAIFIFGLLILIHELGHYLAARIFKVTIKEFSIGMGPRLISYTSKKTNIAYSLRIFPIGGFVSMVGEDEDTEDPNALNKKKPWKRGSRMLTGMKARFAAVDRTAAITSRIWLLR